MRRILGVLVIALLPFGAAAQDQAQTLADLRAELAQLSAQVSGLKQELVASGAGQPGIAGGDALAADGRDGGGAGAADIEDRGAGVPGEPGRRGRHATGSATWSSASPNWRAAT